MAEKILITGANGQLGIELAEALARLHGADAVVTSDIAPAGVSPGLAYRTLDVLDAETLRLAVAERGITQIYHLAAMLSATAERKPLVGWRLNMDGLLNVLEAARLYRTRVFWPSSIAVFGPDAPKEATTQRAPTNPTTVYGISKVAGERWCQYYHDHHQVDVRSIRYPGLISYRAPPGGGTTDYAVDIFRAARERGRYTCYLRLDSAMPMMYMDDAVRATLELMQAPAGQLHVRSSYNLSALSFTPAELAREIQRHRPDFQIDSTPDSRQVIADSWPHSIDDQPARADWGWRPRYGLAELVNEMLSHA